MYRLTLEWTEGTKSRTQTISSDEPTKVPGLIRIKREPTQCDVVVYDPNNGVSRLHAEIFFNPSQHTFYLRNATGNQGQPNTVSVDGFSVIQDEAPLRVGSLIELRNITLKVAASEITQPQKQVTPPITNVPIQNQTPVQGDIKVESSILQRAVQDDSAALKIMFKQFISEDEQIYVARYLGIKGLWGIGTRQFACVTARRLADITVGAFGEFTYQDGYLEDINSCVIYQPSKLGLYFSLALYVAAAIAFTYGIALLALPFVVIFCAKTYYNIIKCGIVLSVKEGVPIYIFANRRLLTRTNALYRQFILCREDRINAIKNIPFLVWITTKTPLH